MGSWEGLNPPYSTIVADPPWECDGTPAFGPSATGGVTRIAHDLPYSALSLSRILELPVALLAGADAHLYLWTTQRNLPAAFNVARAWGFKYSQTLVWAKPPMGIGVGGAYAHNAEFVIFGYRGRWGSLGRVDTSWWLWSRGPHSRKPSGFLDVVERVSPGPYVELFARQPRLGWDSWGYGYEGVA